MDTEVITDWIMLNKFQIKSNFINIWKSTSSKSKKTKLVIRYHIYWWNVCMHLCLRKYINLKKKNEQK